MLILHLAQVYAENGQTAEAIGAFTRVTKTADQQWNNYVLATIAFLKHDQASFDRYAAGENYNADTLQRLRQHWGETYAAAYGA